MWYVVVVIGMDAEAQAFGPFREWKNADAIYQEISDDDGGSGEVDVKLLTLDRPTPRQIKAWLR